MGRDKSEVQICIVRICAGTTRKVGAISFRLRITGLRLPRCPYGVEKILLVVKDIVTTTHIVQTVISSAIRRGATGHTRGSIIPGHKTLDGCVGSGIGLAQLWMVVATNSPSAHEFMLTGLTGSQRRIGSTSYIGA